MDISNRVAKNILILYARMGITMFASLYSTRLVLAALGQNDFGIYSVVGGAIAMQAFLNAAIASATQRYLSYALGEGDTDKLKIIFNVSILGVGICLEKWPLILPYKPIKKSYFI